MNDSPKDERQEDREIEKRFVDKVAANEARKMRARRRREQSIWLGLGLIGTIGWAVAIPMLIGVALGIWLDSRWPGPIPWTLVLLLVGLALGCFNAWYWVMRELRAIERQREEHRRD